MIRKTVGIIILCVTLGVIAIITGYMVEQQNMFEVHMHCPNYWEDIID